MNYNNALIYKWLKSENTSSKESRYLARKTREAFGMTSRQYRKMLSEGRKVCNLVETLMSQNRWDEIEFDKIPSKAGLIYKNAFARRDIIKAKYEKFAKDETTKVNAGTLYPYEVVEKAIKLMSEDFWGRDSNVALDNVDRLMINKYWDNLTDYFNGATLDALCMIDTSGSMRGTPIDVATSIGLYCAERNLGPWHNHYISFSSKPQLIETSGVDFCDKVIRIVRTNLCQNTNIEAAFDLVLRTAVKNMLLNKDLPKNIIVISDMEFDEGTTWYDGVKLTVMESIKKEFNQFGYTMPHLIYWNVDARHNNIPMLDDGPVTYVSGFSPSIFTSILTGKTGYDLMLEAINNERYACIHA